MSEIDRPNPDELLEIVKREDEQRQKGKLKIFLGMAAGVGKTYSMLESAQLLKKEGVDVVIGTIDTHGRVDTEKVLKDLPIIPEKETIYKGSTFKDLDLDGIILRKPQVVLIDEFAHTNIVGARHPKRWQDVREILDNGIDVYTTLNVQHIESLTDVVESITGMKVRESVPDFIIDCADSIELIDITPDELLHRLREGKVYLGDQSTVAAEHFFQKDRLTALREVVMRYSAEKIDHDLLGMISSLERPEAWKTRERLLVAVSHNTHSQKIIRITRRLAFNLNAPWIALHVDEGKGLSPEEEKVLAANLALARDLGAEVITTYGTDLAQTIQRISRQKSVTQIIIGRSPTRWQWLFNWFTVDTLLDKLSRECADIDLHVIRKSLIGSPAPYRWMRPIFQVNYMHYVLVTLFVLIMTLFSESILMEVRYKIVGFLFLFGILSTSLIFGKGPVFFGTILSGLIWFFYFIPGANGVPEFTNDDIILLIFYFLIALSSGVLIDRERKSKEMLLKREKSIDALYGIVQEIAKASTTHDILTAVKVKIGRLFDCKCEIIVKKFENGLIFDENSLMYHNEKEKAAAEWVFHNGKEGGWSTTTLPSSENYYVPLKSANDVVGVLAISKKSDRELNFEEKNFIYTIGYQVANFIERTFSDEKAAKIEHHRQIEKIYQSTLNLISNLFEAPLLTIKEAAQECLCESVSASPDHKPLERIKTSVKTLTRILDNISAMVNLSAGLTPIDRKMNKIAPLIEECFEKIKVNKSDFNWSISIDENIPEIPFDYDLIELLIFNITFHAMEFSLPETTISVEGKFTGNEVVISVAGEGQSIPLEIMDIAFEQLYRMPGMGSSGLGLGLAIARTIAEVHNGQLDILNNPKGGMIFSLRLPAA